jgi:hypothetical protein
LSQYLLIAQPSFPRRRRALRHIVAWVRYSGGSLPGLNYNSRPYRFGEDLTSIQQVCDMSDCTIPGSQEERRAQALHRARGYHHLRFFFSLDPGLATVTVTGEELPLRIEGDRSPDQGIGEGKVLRFTSRLRARALALEDRFLGIAHDRTFGVSDLVLVQPQLVEDSADLPADLLG